MGRKIFRTAEMIPTERSRGACCPRRITAPGMKMNTRFNPRSRGHSPGSIFDRAGATRRGLAKERRSGRNGDHYERWTLTRVAHLTEGAAGDGVDVGPVEGVQLHGSSGARSARMCMRVSGERLAEVGELNGATRSGARAKRQRPNRREAGAPPSRARAARGGPAAPRAAQGGSWRDGHSRCRARSARPTSEPRAERTAHPGQPR